MRWKVTYLIWYPDMVRRGATDCVSREDAFSWVLGAKASRNFLEVVVWFGPKFIHRWKMTEEYSVTGRRYRWFVYKPSTGTKFYVRKVGKDNGRTVGKDKAFPALSTAKMHADAEARRDLRGLI